MNFNDGFSYNNPISKCQGNPSDESQLVNGEDGRTDRRIKKHDEVK